MAVGSRWWKVDFHAHTPASSDYGKGPDQDRLSQRTPREWLLDYMQAGVDCVAVTDHNSGAWVDRLKAELAQMAGEELPTYRALCLLPGVEISVTGGVHVLAIMPEATSTDDISRLLGAVHFRGTPGASDSVATLSVDAVAEQVRAHGGIAIAAHIDQPNGLLNETSGKTLEQALMCDALAAVEVVDAAEITSGLYNAYRERRPEVLGSDAHHPSGAAGQSYPGSRFTWVKMGTPSFEGIRLALVDQSDALVRSDDAAENPNSHASLFIESLEVCDARYLGRGKPFQLGFNPWLNAIIGGRGSGKSTVVEFLRLGLGRRGDIPEQLGSDLAGYSMINSGKNDGLLTQHARIVVHVVKDNVRYRLTLAVDGTDGGPDHASTFEVQSADGTWVAARGRPAEIIPVGLYSQKQVFEMARDPLSLLRIVDAAPDVAELQYAQKRREIETQYLASRSRRRALEEGLVVEESLNGEIDEISRQLQLLEGAEYSEALRNYEVAQREAREVGLWEKTWRPLATKIRGLAQSAEVKELSLAGAGDSVGGESSILTAANNVRAEHDAIASALEALAQRAEAAGRDYDEAKRRSTWRKNAEVSERQYVDTVRRLKEDGVDDPEQFARSVKRLQDLQQQLKELEATREEISAHEEEASGLLDQLVTLRRELTARRTTFLARVLDGNPFVRMSVQPYGAVDGAERAIRELLQREEGFEKDIGVPGTEGGLLGVIPTTHNDVGAVEDALAKMKMRARAIASGSIPEESLGDKRFAGFMKRMQPEALDRIDTWFPEDSLRVEYSPEGNGKEFTKLRTASPGQKTAALLAFLLSYGHEPIILDQPEDDLDNALIYELIVRQVKEQKKRRQLIIVTHNPNIVVNGDAEYVVAMESRGGQSYANARGGLQESDVRETICRIMEGGRRAFELRYRRIGLGRS